MRFNFEGWNFKKWIKKNKDNLRLIVSAVAGIISASLTGISSPTGIAIAGIVTALTKVALDSLDYWISE